MEVFIRAKPPFWWFTTGKHVEVTVRCTDDEVRAIQTYNLSRVPIIDGNPVSDATETDGTVLIRTFESVHHFSDFVGPVASWHAKTDEEAREFIRLLQDGFLNFHKLLDEKLREQAGSLNIRPVVALDDVAKDILYEHLTRKPEAT